MNLKLSNIYQWQIEYRDAGPLSDNTLVLNRYDNGREQSSKSVDPKMVIRVSLLPMVPVLPQHDIYIKPEQGEYFVKWFGRGIIKKYVLAHYLNCVQTNRYRVWVHTDGRVWVTSPESEVYL
jgi:hypothetical protein